MLFACPAILILRLLGLTTTHGFVAAPRHHVASSVMFRNSFYKMSNNLVVPGSDNKQGTGLTPQQAEDITQG
jgi:hypothetical protein